MSARLWACPGCLTQNAGGFLCHFCGAAKPVLTEKKIRLRMSAMEKQRYSPEVRREMILDAALSLAASKGLGALTRQAIAEKAGVSAPLVGQRLGTMKNAMREVMRHAIHKENLAVLLQGLASKDRHALKASAELQARAWASGGARA